ncbi:hypothetical protein GC176_05110 [bacterium]|nr:hypothetical protein [bacterium]
MATLSWRQSRTAKRWFIVINEKPAAGRCCLKAGVVAAVLSASLVERWRLDRRWIRKTSDRPRSEFLRFPCWWHSTALAID